MTSQLIIFDPLEYNKKLRAYLKKHIPKSGNVLYVTLNKTYLEISEFIEAEKLDLSRFHFLDGVTTKLFRTKDLDNCTFFESLENLSLFTDEVLNVMKMKRINLMVFDSLSSMMIYKQDYEIISFLESIWPYLKKLKVDSVFIALSDDRGKPAVKQVAMMVDESIAYEFTK